MPTLTPDDIESFIANGYVRLDDAFSQLTATAAREILWPETGCDRNNPATWTRPVVRLGGHSEAPFREAANTPGLREALDQIAGEGRWQPLMGLGTFPVRFPSDEDPGDTGWHVDASFPGDDPSDFLAYRINHASRGRALLLLFLFSDTGENDAPTRLRAGSHLDVARILEPEGDAGLSFMDLASRLDVTDKHPVAHATGPAGTVYICHPFLVHAAQQNHVGTARFMAQPPLLPTEPLSLDRPDAAYSPAEQAIRRTRQP